MNAGRTTKFSRVRPVVFLGLGLAGFVVAGCNSEPGFGNGGNADPRGTRLALQGLPSRRVAIEVRSIDLVLQKFPATIESVGGVYQVSMPPPRSSYRRSAVITFAVPPQASSKVVDAFANLDVIRGEVGALQGSSNTATTIVLRLDEPVGNDGYAYR